MNRLVKSVRWFVALPAGVLAAVAIWLLASVALDMFGKSFPDWRFLLVMAYAHIAAGFVFAGTVTKIAPDRRTKVALAMIGVALGAALLLLFRGDYGFGANLVFALSLLAGAIGYALRLRGFSEALDADI